MQKKESIQRLICRCEDFFRDSGYSELVILSYHRRWKNGIVSFMENRNLTEYDPSVGQDYLAYRLVNGKSTKRETRAIHVLNDMLLCSTVYRYNGKRSDCPLYGQIGKDIENFLLHLKSIRRASETIKHYRKTLSIFALFLEKECDVVASDGITEDSVTEFLKSYSHRKMEDRSFIRVFLKFLSNRESISHDFEPYFLQNKVSKRFRIPSFYSKEEVLAVEKSVKRDSPTGKRNYAMLLLATRLGLRVSDIARLEFSNIDWENNTISIAMEKTGKCIELPLLVDVGNSIIDYLRHARKSGIETNRLFLTTCAPYEPVSKWAVARALHKLVSTSGIDISGKHHGAHSMRHSLATNMLQEGTSLPVISEALGHSSTDTTMKYITVDLKQLSMCSLDVPPVPETFYMQKGGLFYANL